MKLLIADTCILIDLYNGDILPMVSKLPYEIGFSDALFTELKHPTYDDVIKANLIEYSLPAESVIDVYSLNEKYPNPSIPDLFSLIVARDNKAILLTGDKKLRKAAKIEGIDFRGIFWILDELIEHSIINKEAASRNLQEILDKGAFLPKTECQKRFEHWK